MGLFPSRQAAATSIRVGLSLSASSAESCTALLPKRCRRRRSMIPWRPSPPTVLAVSGACLRFPFSTSTTSELAATCTAGHLPWSEPLRAGIGLHRYPGLDGHLLGNHVHHHQSGGSSPRGRGTREDGNRQRRVLAEGRLQGWHSRREYLIIDVADEDVTDEDIVTIGV